MMRIEPITLPTNDSELNALLARADKLGVPDPQFTALLARAPGYAKPLLRALLDSHENGNVDHKLKEMIRVQLARYAGDRYFGTLRSKRATAEGLDESRINAACDDYLRDPRFSEAERAALEYADQMYRNPDANDAAFYDRLKRHFSEAQIMEIGAFIAFHYGMQTFMRAMGARA
jgi:alkylhydroperoxidase family enzyme